MQHVLVYGDSMAWGMVPGTRQRASFSARWPGLLEAAINDAGGPQARVVENCLPGRRTVWDDPYRPGRNGAVGLSELVEACSPLAVVVLALGTNDFQGGHDVRAWGCASGVARLVDIVRNAPVEPGMPHPRILVLAPPDIVSPKGMNALKFEGASERSRGLGAAFSQMAADKKVGFFDLGVVTQRSEVDGIHLDAQQHAAIARALAPLVSQLVAEGSSGPGEASGIG